LRKCYERLDILIKCSSLTHKFKPWYKRNMPATTILAPLVNPNEPEAVIQAIHAPDRQSVSKGDALCTLETTKSTLEVEAPTAGYVVGWRFKQGQVVAAGEALCHIAESADWSPPEVTETSSQPIPGGWRFTQPAEILAREYGLDLESFPPGVLITEAMVKDAIKGPLNQELAPPQGAIDPTALLIYGIGGHGKALLELLKAQGSFHIVGFIDDTKSPGEEIMGLPVLGGRQALLEVYRQGVRLAVNAVGGIGNIGARIEVFRRLAVAGFTCPVVVHPTAYVETSAQLAPGVQVMPHAYVGSQAAIGFGSIVNTGAIVSHDCILGKYTNLSPGAILAGEVQVGDRVLIGMGATINLQVMIGAGARIGNGATIKNHVPENAVVRAGSTWPY
jgi:sugar O-acyltransferase (sialic acid O-acetyltransferase NeuD family)